MKILAFLLMFVPAFVNAQCAVPQQDGSLTLTTETIDTCSGLWLTPASQVRNYQAVEVTPEGFLQAFTFGITLYLTFWYGPYLVSLARQLINKL